MIIGSFCFFVCVLCRRGCGRKRKGTPVKVFVTHTEEDGAPEHSLSSGLCCCVCYFYVVFLFPISCDCMCVLALSACASVCLCCRRGPCVSEWPTFMCVCLIYMCCSVHLCICVCVGISGGGVMTFMCVCVVYSCSAIFLHSFCALRWSQGRSGG